MDDGDEADLYAPVIVEMGAAPGLREVSLNSADVLKRSGKALQQAMGAVRSMAERVHETVSSLAERPSQVTVEFGIKFDTEAHAVVAKAGSEASLKVKLTWDLGSQE